MAGFVFCLWLQQTMSDVAQVIVQNTGSLEGYCDASYVGVGDDQKYHITADNANWGGDEDECKAKLVANSQTDDLYVYFLMFDVEDCGVKFTMSWGETEPKGRKIYDCKHAPELKTATRVQGEHAISLNLEGAKSATKSFNITFEIAVNETYFHEESTGTMNMLSILTITLAIVLPFIIQ